MKNAQIVPLLFFTFFVNVLLSAQNDISTKYPNHPLTAINFNLGINNTGSAKGTLAPGSTFGIDLEHHFKNSPFGFNIGYRDLVIKATSDLTETKFQLTEFFGKVSYRISKKMPLYAKVGYSNGNIYEYEGTNLNGLVRRVHFANLGFEHKFFVPEKLLISAELNYKLTNIYDQLYGDIHTFELIFRIGKR